MRAERFARRLLGPIAVAGALAACAPDVNIYNGQLTPSPTGSEVNLGPVASPSFSPSPDASPSPTLSITPSASASPSESVVASPTETEAPELSVSDKLYERFALDIVDSIPQLDVDTVEQQLRTIPLPEGVHFVSEPGDGLIPNVATDDVISEDEPAHRNAPEGGYAYTSFGGGTLSFDGQSYDFPYIDDNVHLVWVIGKPDDTTEEDLNTTVDYTGYTPGHVFVAQGAPRQDQEISGRGVINDEWLRQQLWHAILSGTNCGVGCEFTVRFTQIDALSGQEVTYVGTVNADNAGLDQTDFSKAISWSKKTA